MTNENSGAPSAPRFPFPMGDKELKAAIAALPPETVEELKRGPQPEPGCQVCDSLLHLAHSDYCGGARTPADDLLNWHASLGVDSDGRWIEIDGDTQFARCLSIYIAAGWEPEGKWVDTIAKFLSIDPDQVCSMPKVHRA